GGSLHNEVEKNPGGNIAVSHGYILFTRIIAVRHGAFSVTRLILCPLTMEYFITRLVFRPSGQREAMRIRGYAGLRLSFAKINKNH
ncbi:MAG: hypothetical protein PUD32_07645, partial [Bacteroidales bacterium]|nr:hypothetical protein [Bacteroidales bacterium]